MLKSIKWTSGIISHEIPAVTFSGYNTEYTTTESSVDVGQCVYLDINKPRKYFKV